MMSSTITNPRRATVDKAQRDAVRKNRNIDFIIASRKAIAARKAFVGLKVSA